jgi:hypothetical protein
MNRFWQRWIGWRRWRGTVARQRYLRWTEWLGIALWFLCLSGVLMAYQTLLVPLNRRLNSIVRETSNIRRQTENLRLERQRLEQEVAAFQSAMENWQRFERELLRDARPGQLALIDEINALARKYEVKLTDTVTFTMRGQEKNLPSNLLSGGRPSSGKERAQPLQSYPAFDVKFGLTGSYRNLRRFIQALEQSRQFLLIQLLSFTPGSNESQASSKSPAFNIEQTPATSGELTVTLSLTAYFRSDSSIPLSKPVDTSP